MRIEDYAVIGDTHTAALVGLNGSIDWLCLPRFDSSACFAALLGSEENGHWRIAPAGGVKATRRKYRGDSLVLVTEFETDTGTVEVIDCMPPREVHPQVARLVKGVKGRVEMRMELVVRFEYGSVVPWVWSELGLLELVAGPDALSLWTPIDTRGEDLQTVAEFSVGEGQRIPFSLSWRPPSDPPPRPVAPDFAIRETTRWWQAWAESSTYNGEWQDTVMRSLLTLKALTYAPTGGIVAAATTSLPEQLGGPRNWDYRYCWLRDATLTLSSLMIAGYVDEATSWRDWLLRAAAGDPKDLQIMYGPAGERRLSEYEADWLSGYEGSTPVRIGNAAAEQFQLDVYGEVMSTLHTAREHGMVVTPHAWGLQKVLVDFLETGWKEPDDGIWEVRGPRRHFTHSKMMAWVAMDRAVKGCEMFGFDGPVDKWRAVARDIHDEVCEKAWDPKRRTFTQYYGSKELDASLLMMPLVGFLPATHPKMAGTIDAIQRELTEDGFVKRYQTDDEGTVDGLSGGEGSFLPCSFWMVDNLAQSGRVGEAREMFERLISVRNDVGLLSEEYDSKAGRLVGNFPQAFSHVSLVNSAANLSAMESGDRSQGGRRFRGQEEGAGR
jgi:GH15 family glucan-1,4-alpha-glucosidase